VEIRNHTPAEICGLVWIENEKVIKSLAEVREKEI